MKRLLFSCSVLLVVTFMCSGWGFLVHRTVNQLAIYQLKGDLREFFFKNRQYLVYNAPRPDLRRNTDTTEDKKHFIDFEAYGDSAAWKMPFSWQEAVDKYSKDSLLEYGYVPYQIIEIQRRLTEAFRQKNKDSILFYAADLGHYIGDAHVPLHTTINYDGQLSGQKGLHSLWESFIPELEMNQYRLYNRRKAHYVDDPAAAVWSALREAHQLVPSMLQIEKEVSVQFTDSTKFRVQVRRGKQTKSYTSEFAKAYAAALQPSINEQLLASANMIADFWYTAWKDAGKPDMEDMTGEFHRAEKKELKRELKSWKNNRLIADSLLISRQRSGGTE